MAEREGEQETPQRKEEGARQTEGEGSKEGKGEESQRSCRAPQNTVSVLYLFIYLSIPSLR